MLPLIFTCIEFNVTKTSKEKKESQEDHKKLLVCYAPTYPSKLALPKKLYGHSGEMIFIFVVVVVKKPQNNDSVSDKCSNQNFLI